MFVKLNINPLHKRADDCTVRAIATILNKPWEEIYADLCLEGLRYYDMPSANHVWGSYLKKKGFQRHIIPDTCPLCYTVEEFARDHPDGEYILALSGHVVPVISDTIKNLGKISEMEEQGYSYGMGGWNANGSYSNGMNPMSYGRGQSYGDDRMSGRRSGNGYSGNGYSNEAYDAENRMRREMNY